MGDWNLEDRILRDTRRGILPQKECTRGRSKKHPRKFLVMQFPKNPERVYYRWRRASVIHRCLSLEHAEQMLAKCVREGLDKRYNLWIEAKE